MGGDAGGAAPFTGLRMGGNVKSNVLRKTETGNGFE